MSRLWDQIAEILANEDARHHTEAVKRAEDGAKQLNAEIQRAMGAEPPYERLVMGEDWMCEWVSPLDYDFGMG